MEETYWGVISKETNKNSPDKIDKTISYCETIGNQIYFYSDIETPSILKLTKELLLLSNKLLYQKITDDTNNQNIVLNIKSFGGYFFSGIAGMDKIITSHIPITTIIDGCCASAATFLSLVGERRKIHSHAYMLIHQLSSSFWGKYSDFEDEKINLDKMMDTIKEIYNYYTKVPEKKINQILKHDIWFTAQECLDYGMVDEIYKNT